MAWPDVGASGASRFNPERVFLGEIVVATPLALTPERVLVGPLLFFLENMGDSVDLGGASADFGDIIRGDGLDLNFSLDFGTLVDFDDLVESSPV